MPIFDPASLQKQVAVSLSQMAPEAQQSTSSGKPHDEALWPYLLAELGQGADMATTIAAHGNPNLKESNPMGFGGTVATKAVLMAVLPYLIHKAYEADKPGRAKALGIIGALTGGIPAAMNLRTMGNAK